MYTDLTFSPHPSFGMGIKLALNFIWNGIKKALKSLEFHLEDPGGTLDSHLMSIWQFHLSKTIVMSYNVIHRLQKPKSMTGSHGNLSKYKFGLAEYITVYVIQLQQLLQLLLRIITQYAKYVYFKFYKMLTECFWVISVLMLLLILLILLFI